MSAEASRTAREWIDRHPMYLQNRKTGRCFRCGEIVPAFTGAVFHMRENGQKVHRIGHLPVVGTCTFEVRP